MSEDDRAAKAARAKAMLKKRQQKKVGGASGTGIASPPASPSLRAFSPAPSEVPPVTEDKTDLGDVFSQSNSDTNWVASLPRVETPPSRPPSRPQSIPPGPPRPSTPAVSSPLVSSPAPNDQTSELRTLVQTHQQTISQLQSKNASLEESLKHSQDLESKTRETERQLQESHNEGRRLSDRVRQLETDARLSNERVEQLTTREKDIIEKSREQIQNQQQTISLLVSEKTSLTASLDRLEELESQTHEKEALLQEERNQIAQLNHRVQGLESDLQEAAEKYREQERELQLTNGTVDELRVQTHQHQRRVHELEEHIQSDDRAERLEQSLKNTQERADEFEFQLSKLKQAHTSLKLERDEIDAKLRLQVDAETEWKNKHTELIARHSLAQEQLTTIASEKDVLLNDKTSLKTEIDANHSILAELQQKLAMAASELVSSARQLQSAHADLRNANRRAEEAEKTQKDLQAEGTNLMRSLDEMRPKIVELTGDKVELGNKVDSLEHALRKRDAMIVKLETAIEEVRDEYEDLKKEREGATVQREREQSSVQASLTELQKAYAELQSELDEARTSLHGMEAERTNHHRVASRQLDEIDRLTSSSRAQADEFSSVKKQLEEHMNLEEEDRGFIERAQEEIEALRAELISSEEEIDRLRDAVASGSSPDGVPESLDAEMLSALKQQHALDLSTAQSQIRALETSAFDAQAKAHALQKRVHTLEDQLATPSRSGSRAGRPFSPSRPSSRALNRPHPSNDLPPLSRSVFDIGLTPETRHKRRVSLGMLKARIDGELAAAVSGPPSRANKSKPSSLSTVNEPRSQRSPSTLAHSFIRPQLDESHIFWCNSCKADLIIL